MALQRLASPATSRLVQIRHKQPVGHAFLEMPDHRALGARNRNRQRLARGRSELDNIGAVPRIA